MALRDTITTALRDVVSVTAGIGATWQYRQLTSALDAETRTYGSLANIVGHQSNRTHSEPFKNDRGVWVRMERCGFRVSDAATELKQGDQLVDTASNYWAVMGILSSGVGTRRYDLSREVPLLADGDRGGGV